MLHGARGVVLAVVVLVAVVIVCVHCVLPVAALAPGCIPAIASMSAPVRASACPAATAVRAPFVGLEPSGNRATTAATAATSNADLLWMPPLRE